MKSLLITVAIGLSALSFTACTESSLPGGFSSVSVTEQSVVDVANFAVHAKNAELKAHGQPSRIALVKISHAERQVVAGWNYVLTLKVTQDGQPKTIKATVWYQGWRKPDPYRLTDWVE